MSQIKITIDASDNMSQIIYLRFYNWLIHSNSKSNRKNNCFELINCYYVVHLYNKDNTRGCFVLIMVYSKMFKKSSIKINVLSQ